MTGSFYFSKGLFVSRMGKLLIRAVRAVCQDPSARNYLKLTALFMFVFPSLRQGLWLTFDGIRLLLIRQPLDQLRDALFPCLIRYLSYILLA